MSSRVNHDVFWLPEGNVAFSYPEKFSPDGLQDMKEWLALIVKRVERSNLKRRLWALEAVLKRGSHAH